MKDSSSSFEGLVRNEPENNITIIKIGSNVLVDEHGKVRKQVIADVFAVIAERIKQGEKILLVTSGAVAIGSRANNNQLDKKLAAGIGQMHLMSAYLEIAKKLGLTVSELLLSRPHLVEREHFLQLQKSIEDAFVNKIVPIVNENDTLVYGTNWGFPDNDTLAASLAIAFGAERLLILSHVAGLYTADPEKNINANLIENVTDVNAELMKYCTGNIAAGSRGGMLAKLKAARLCTAVGIKVQIVNGFNQEAIVKAVRGEKAGTVFLPRRLQKKIKNRDRWILAAKSSAASIEIDDGAMGALHKGKSLLAVGIKKIYGSFAQGELVEIINKQKEGIAIGIVKIDSKALEQTLFKKQRGIEVIHTDNMMVFA